MIERQFYHNADIEQWAEDNLFGDRVVQGIRVPLTPLQIAMVKIAVDVIQKWEHRGERT